MAKGARPKKELSMKADTKFRGKWYTEDDLKDKLLGKIMEKGLPIPEDHDIEEMIEIAYERDIKV